MTERVTSSGDVTRAGADAALHPAAGWAHQPKSLGRYRVGAAAHLFPPGRFPARQRRPPHLQQCHRGPTGVRFVSLCPRGLCRVYSRGEDLPVRAQIPQGLCRAYPTEGCVLPCAVFLSMQGRGVKAHATECAATPLEHRKARLQCRVC